MSQWTSEIEDECARVLRSSYTAKEAAAHINEMFKVDITRNAVIGMANRREWLMTSPYALALHKSMNNPKREPAPKRPRKPKVVKAPDPPPLVKKPDPPLILAPLVTPREPHEWNGAVDAIASLGLDRCKWPIGDPRNKDFRFCLKPSAGKTYCPACRELAYQPPMPRKRAA
jgi:GcrA cell cycle regulator